MWRTYDVSLVQSYKDDPAVAVEQMFDQRNATFSMMCTDIYASCGADASVFDTLLEKVREKEKEAGIVPTEAEKIVNLNESHFEFFCVPAKSTIVELARKIVVTFDAPTSYLKLGMLAGSLARLEG